MTLTTSPPYQNGATSYACKCPDSYEGMNCDHITTKCEADT